jgi:ABC-type transport system substrate-binding protein
LRTFLAVFVISMVAGLIWYFRSPFDAETIPSTQISEQSALELEPSDESASADADVDQVAATTDSAGDLSATDAPALPLAENYFDWQLAVGPVTSKLLEATSEPLIQLSDDQDISYRLAKEIIFAAKVSSIKLKDGIYWSDQTRLNAQQALDGFNRLKTALTEGNWNHTDPDLYRWLKQLTIKAIDLDTLEIVGLSDEVELKKLAASLALRPVRKDLLERFSDIRAWQVAIGAYVISDSGANGELVLEPNSLYFRGAPTEPLKITLAGK